MNSPKTIRRMLLVMVVGGVVLFLALLIVFPFTGQLDGLRVTVGFASEPAGPAWTLKHNGWADPGEVFITVNAAASTIQLDQLQIVITGQSTKPGVIK